jgi:hypothetical protein
MLPGEPWTIAQQVALSERPVTALALPEVACARSSAGRGESP